MPTATGGYTVSYSLGEAVVETIAKADSTRVMTQGFEQPENLECGVLRSSKPATVLASDSVWCDAPVALNGNDPGNGITGNWYEDGDLVSADPQYQPADLSGGKHSFLWVLSSDGCEGYDSAQVEVRRLFPPVAINDYIHIFQGRTVDYDLVSNDSLLDLEGGYHVGMIGQAGPGLVVQVASDGMSSFMTDSVFYGSDTIRYVLCNQRCQVCDTALLIMEVKRLYGNDFSEGITPNNGDNINNTFFICDDCQIDEFIVYNRWGDKVFESQHYLNDWAGTTNSGKDLPASTYYYYAKIDGKTRVGRVTIVR